MKKTFCFLFTALLFLLALTGCEQTAVRAFAAGIAPSKGGGYRRDGNLSGDHQTAVFP